MEDVEQIIIKKPLDFKQDACIRCHKKLVFRKPLPAEQRKFREQFMQQWDENICRNEDVFAISNTCECGQEGIVLYNVNMDSLK